MSPVECHFSRVLKRCARARRKIIFMQWQDHCQDFHGCQQEMLILIATNGFGMLLARCCRKKMQHHAACVEQQIGKHFGPDWRVLAAQMERFLCPELRHEKWTKRWLIAILSWRVWCSLKPSVPRKIRERLPEKPYSGHIWAFLHMQNVIDISSCRTPTRECASQILPRIISDATPRWTMSRFLLFYNSLA